MPGEVPEPLSDQARGPGQLRLGKLEEHMLAGHSRRRGVCLLFLSFFLGGGGWFEHQLCFMGGNIERLPWRLRGHVARWLPAILSAPFSAF